MATRNFTVSKQYMADTGSFGGGSANPGDTHIPLGKWDSGTGLTWVTRACLYAPVSFSGMVSITAARLYLRQHTASGWHAKGDSSVRVGVRRKTSSWSETSEGASASVDETWGGDGRDVVNGGYVNAGDGTTALDATDADNTLVYIDITETVQDWFAGSANHGVMIFAADSDDSANIVESGASEFYSRHASGKQPYIWIEYETNTPPNAPTTLSPTGDAVRHTGTSVTLSGTRSDPDSGDYITGYQIQVKNDALTTTYHDSYTYPSGSPTTFSKTVSGLPTGVFLEWRARTRDRDDEWGAWSSYQRFKLNSVPNAPSLSLLESPTTDIKTLTPTLKITHSDPDSADTKLSAYRLLLVNDDTEALVYDSGETSITAVTTASILYAGAGLSWGVNYKWTAMTKDQNGAWSEFANYKTFFTHEAGAPISLSPTGGATVGGLTPTLSGSRATSADSLTSAQIQVYSADGSTLIWDSSTFTTGVTSTGFTKAYAGTALAYDTDYQWRARVTSSVGGISDWSALQAFSTPPASALLMSAPVGSGITDLTPNFDFSRTSSFNAYQIILMDSVGATLWDSGTVTHASATSKSITYPGSPALAWSTSYQWKVRVSSDSGSSWGAGYTDAVTFTTDEAGVPDLLLPAVDAWLGERMLCDGESLEGVTGNAYSTVTLTTDDFEEGAHSLKATVASHPSGTTSIITVACDLDLSDYPLASTIGVSTQISSLTNVTALVMRLTDSGGAYVEYDVKPGSTGVFAAFDGTLGAPDASSGTMDWSSVVSITFRLTSSATVSTNILVDNLTMEGDLFFEGEATGGETIDTVRVKVFASDQTTEVWDSGEETVTDTEFSVAYDGTALTAGQTYYWTARYTESTGPTGGYAPLRAFRLNSTPSAVNLSPSTGDVIADTLTPEFTAEFSDPDTASNGDLPSAFEVEVNRNSDSVLMHTLLVKTDLVAGRNVAQRTSEGTALSYDVEYKWRARYFDSFGIAGPWSSYNVFTPSESPTVSITSPVSTVTSPSFDIVWTFTSPDDKDQNRFRVTITRDSDEALIYDSGTVFSSVSSHTLPGGYLVNSTDYTITVVAYDSDGLASVEDTEAITSAWTAPDSITGFSVTPLDETSEMLLNWDVSNLDSEDFSYYQIYRREAGSEWEKYDRVTTQSTTSYSDFFAGHSLTYEYKMTVWKTVVGDVDVESSDSEIPYVILDPDAWFVVGADRDDSHIFELPVYDEDHTEPIQQEVFEPLGSRRKSVVRGKVLGQEGTLKVQWTDSERRDAQTQLRYLADNPGPHILKSPFGDVWEVEFSGPARKYSGGGHMGVTLTWIEVT